MLLNTLKPIMVAIALLAFTTQLDASIIRVNNTGADADYTALQAAIDAAMNGDTIHLEPSSMTYGDITLNKPLTIIGPGYLLDENTNLQASPITSKVNSITLATGCNNSNITGLEISGIYRSGEIGEVNITRNLINTISFSASQNVNNLFISHNFFETSTTYSIYITGGGSKTLTIANNIFTKTNTHTGYINFAGGSDVTAVNNCFDAQTVTATNTVFQNNIFTRAGITNSGNCSFANNIAQGNYLPTGNGNVNNATPANIYEDYPNTSSSFTKDSRYQLKSGSPAIGAGISGEDCGAFGTATPYRISGIPAIPSIYKFVAPSIVTGNFNVTISTRSNN